MQACPSFSHFQRAASPNGISTDRVALGAIQIDPIQHVADLVVLDEISAGIQQDSGILVLQIPAAVLDCKASDRAAVGGDPDNAVPA